MRSDGVRDGPAGHAPGPPSIALGGYFGWVIVELAPDAIFVVDERGRCVLGNRRAQDLFGYDRDGLLGLGVEALLPVSLRASHRAHRADYEASPTTRPMGSGLDLCARRADGCEFPVEISLSPVTVSAGTYVVVTVREVPAHRDNGGPPERARAAETEAGVADFHENVIEHLFAAGIAIASLGERLDDDQTRQLTTATDELDLAIREIRSFAVRSFGAVPAENPHL